jgi:hypothetical protein
MAKQTFFRVKYEVVNSAMEAVTQSAISVPGKNPEQAREIALRNLREANPGLRVFIKTCKRIR